MFTNYLSQPQEPRHASNIKEKEMINVLPLMWLLLLHPFLHVLAFQALAGRATPTSRTVALAVFLQAVALLALTLYH